MISLDDYIPEPNTGCWIALGSLNSGGYSHLLNYVKGPKRGFERHHKCNMRCCINKAHVEYLSIGEHHKTYSKVKDLERFPCGHLRKQFYLQNGSAKCKECRRINSKRYREKRRSKQSIVKQVSQSNSQ